MIDSASFCTVCIPFCHFSLCIVNLTVCLFSKIQFETTLCLIIWLFFLTCYTSNCSRQKTVSNQGLCVLIPKTESNVKALMSTVENTQFSYCLINFMHVKYLISLMGNISNESVHRDLILAIAAYVAYRTLLLPSITCWSIYIYKGFKNTYQYRRASITYLKPCLHFSNLVIPVILFELPAGPIAQMICMSVNLIIEQSFRSYQFQ